MKNRYFQSILSLILAVSILFSFSAYFVSNATTKTGTVNIDRVRVRTSPTTTKDNKYMVGGTVVNLNNGDVIEILDTVNSIDDEDHKIWYHIEFTYNNSTHKGYVYSEYVTVNKTSGDYEMPDGVPEIYKEYIEKLLSSHPNWNFIFHDVGYEWKDLFTEDAQCYLGRSLIYYTQPISYRSTQSGAYDWKKDKWYNPENESGWYQANAQTIAYYMDPRNFLNESNIFMFEALSYDNKTQTIDGVKKILSDSFMDNVKIKNTNGKSVLYAQAYVDAAKAADVSPYHLASRTIQEVSKSGSGSTSGKYIAKNGTDYSGYYNFYNINAYAGSDPISYGLRYASGKNSNGKPLSKETLAKYDLPWNSQYKAIVGGAKWIGNGYINNKQDTLYYQKYNSLNQVWTHQYMANIMAPYTESSVIRKTYFNLGILDDSFTFIIPYYRNMPAKACELPEANNLNPNNWLSSLTVDGYSFAFNGSKRTGYSITVPATVSSVNINAKTVNAKATVKGVGKVSLEKGSNIFDIVVTAQNGNKRKYTLEIIKSTANEIPLKGISLNTTELTMYNGDTKKLTVSFNPSNTTDSKSVKWSSSDPSVVTVSKGNVVAIGKGKATITAKVGNMTATCNVTVTNDFIVGDVDADQVVTISDALMIFKSKTGEVSLSSTALKAADTNKNDVVELSDALRIFKYKSGEIDSL